MEVSASHSLSSAEIDVAEKQVNDAMNIGRRLVFTMGEHDCS